MSTPIISVDELCTAVEGVLRATLADATVALGFDRDQYGAIKEWQQLPTTDALASAKLPAAAVSSSGLVDRPTRSRASAHYKTTWRIAIGIYDRGKDHDDTQRRVRNWCAAIRMALLANKTLGGVAETLTWAGEEYALLPNRNQARTIAAGAVAVDVTAFVIGDLPTATEAPVVVVTTPTLTATAPGITEE